MNPRQKAASLAVQLARGLFPAAVTLVLLVLTEWVARGELTQEEARVHPKKNLITRALGVDPEVSEDAFQVQAQPGDRLLLCSDGLSNVLSDQQILELSRGEDLEESCRRLLTSTLEAGAPDNVTVVMARL